MSANQKIVSRLSKKEEGGKKMLTLPFKEEQIRSLDSIAKAMTRHSGRTVSRNMLIGDAVDSYIEEAEAVFREEGIALDLPDREDFDTVVFPAQYGEEYRKAFFEDLEWRYVRVAAHRIPKLRYLALYVGAPQSAILHYAPIAENGFVFVEAENKYKIRLSDNPISLPNPIPLGSASPQATRSPKYTTLQKLLCATEFRELY